MLYILFAVLLMGGLVWAAFWWMNRGTKDFDERQLQTQRKAYQLGFFIESTYMLCLFIYITLAGDPSVSLRLLLMLGIWLPAIPVITCMIWKDAYLKSSQSHLGFGIAGIVLGVMNLRIFVNNIPRLSWTGSGSMGWTQLLVGILWLWLGGLLTVKHFLNKREEKAE